MLCALCAPAAGEREAPVRERDRDLARHRPHLLCCQRPGCRCALMLCAFRALAADPVPVQHCLQASSSVTAASCRSSVGTHVGTLPGTRRRRRTGRLERYELRWVRPRVHNEATLASMRTLDADVMAPASPTPGPADGAPPVELAAHPRRLIFVGTPAGTFMGRKRANVGGMDRAAVRATSDTPGSPAASRWPPPRRTCQGSAAPAAHNRPT